MVTHHLGIADRIADTVAVMNHGEIVEYGSTKQVLYQPENSYTRMLLEKIPRIRRFDDRVPFYAERKQMLPADE